MPEDNLNDSLVYELVICQLPTKLNKHTDQYELVKSQEVIRLLMQARKELDELIADILPEE